MSATGVGVSRVDRDALRAAIADKCAQVATTPEIGYPLPRATVESFAGTGNPFLQAGGGS